MERLLESLDYREEKKRPLESLELNLLMYIAKTSNDSPLLIKLCNLKHYNDDKGPVSDIRFAAIDRTWALATGGTNSLDEIQLVFNHLMLFASDDMKTVIVKNMKEKIQEYKNECFRQQYPNFVEPI